MTILRGFLLHMSGFKQKINFFYDYSKSLLQFLAIIRDSAPGAAVFIAIALLLQGTIPAASVWITKQIVDAVATATQREYLSARLFWSLIVAWVGLLLLSNALNPWVTALQGNLNDKLNAHLNLLLIRKAGKLPDLSRFEDPRFYDELQLIRTQIFQPFGLLASLYRGGPQLLTIITMFGLLIPIGWWIPVLILATTFPQTYISLQLQKKAWDVATLKSSESRNLQYCQFVMLTDTYAKEVLLFRLGPFFSKQYVEVFQNVYRAMSSLRQKQAYWSTSLAVLSTAGNAFAFYWVIQQSFSGRLSPGNVLLIIQALAYIQQGLSQLVQTSTMLYDALLYMKRFFAFLESKPMMIVRSPGKPVPLPVRQGITFERVHFCYPDGRVALKNVSFTIYPGETVALVGENGAGKTSIVKLLARFYDPTDGIIWVDGEKLQDLDLEAWREQIAIAFQDFGRYALTLGENIALGDLSALDDLERLKSAEEKADLQNLVARLPDGLQTLLGKQFGGTEISGGEWQKLALARSFIREKAQILILDEPTASLDPRSEQQVYHQFTTLKQDKTSILITHRLASVSMADRILVLKNGYLIEEGTHAELLKQDGEYAILWKMQAKQYSL
jgi:ATP-binding cassette, subfamily B, bacterial